MPHGRLVTASCTTRWDWIHGELWVLPGGILRARLDRETTKAHGLERTVPEAPIEREFDDAEIAVLVSEHRANLWIPADRIASARFRFCSYATELRLGMRDQRDIRLCFLRVDAGAEPIMTALEGCGVRVSTKGSRRESDPVGMPLLLRALRRRSPRWLRLVTVATVSPLTMIAFLAAFHAPAAVSFPASYATAMTADWAVDRWWQRRHPA